MKVSFYNSSDVLQKEIEYVYDVFDRRIEKRLDSEGNGSFETEEHYVYDGGDIVLQYDESSSLTNRYLHGPAVDQVLADEDALDNVLWPLADNLGTVRDLVDDNGDVQNHLTYDAFGNITSESDNTVDHLYAFTGREWDPDAELYYYRARWYDPAVGRFLSEYPIGFAAGDPNLYAYVFNSPTNFIDPSGLESVALPLPPDALKNPLPGRCSTKICHGRPPQKEFRFLDEGNFNEAALGHGVGFVPGLGDALDVTELVTGKDRFGNDLTGFDYGATAVGAALPFVPGSVARRFGNALKDALSKAGEYAKAAYNFAKRKLDLQKQADNVLPEGHQYGVRQT